MYGKGFIKAASVTPVLKVGNPLFNVKEMVRLLKEVKSSITVFPELGVTAYTCNDLFYQESLLKNTKTAIAYLLKNNKYKNILIKLSQGEKPISKEEKRIAGLFGPKARPSDFKNAAFNIRCQTGLKQEFMDGLSRSGAVIDKFKSAGINVYTVGVIYMKTKEEVDQAFEYAKTAEMKMIVGVPNHELLDYVEGKVKEYDIKLAIHNHGPGDLVYPSAESAYVLIKNRDKRMGLCIDIGHTKRINRDPEQDVKDFFYRVFDIHIKDVTAAEKDGQTCIIGRGVINFPFFSNIFNGIRKISCSYICFFIYQKSLHCFFMKGNCLFNFKNPSRKSYQSI